MVRITVSETAARMKSFRSAICLIGAVAALIAAAGTAHADWREDLSVLRIGILAHGDPRKAVTRAEPFRLAVADRLGIAVEIFPARDFAALVDATASAHIEYAVMSATAYALASNRCQCVEPLAVARSGDGTSAFHEVVITRQDGAASLPELKGKHITATEANAFGGLDIALRQMRREGFDAADGDAQFKPVKRSDLAIAALRDREAEGLVGWSSMNGEPGEGYSRGTLRQIGSLGGDIAKYRIIWQSVAIPHRVHAVRKSLPAEARQALGDLLSTLFDDDPVAYDAIEPVYGGGLVPASQDQFAPLAALLKTADAATTPEADGISGEDTSGEPVIEQPVTGGPAPNGESDEGSG
jgi:phosphonate transport system substrate-binding protein